MKYYDLISSIVKAENIVLTKEVGYLAQVEIIQNWKYQNKYPQENLFDFNKFIDSLPFDFSLPIVYNYAFSDTMIFECLDSRSTLDSNEINNLKIYLFDREVDSYLKKIDAKTIFIKSPGYEVFFHNYKYFLNKYYGINEFILVWEELISKAIENDRLEICRYLERTK